MWMEIASTLFISFIFFRFIIIKFLWSLRHSLENEAVFITGCDHGFGYHLARRLANKKMMVFAGCYSDSSEGANKLSTEFSSTHLQVVQVDVTSDTSVTKAIDFIKKRVGDRGLWALVNNAGIASVADVELCSIDEFRSVWDVNVAGPIRCVQGCLPLLRQTKGRIINMASIFSSLPGPSLSAYSASKAAIFSLSNALNIELRKFGILSISLRPYFFRTNIVNSKPLIEHFEKSYANIPDDVKQVYGKQYVECFLKGLTFGESESSSNLDLVVDTLETAVMARYPRRDYTLPVMYSSILLAVVNILPQGLSERILCFIIPKHHLLSLQSMARKDARTSSYLF